MYREHTKVVKIGNRVIGGGNPILIQSMTNTKTEDVRATVAQIQALTAAGCDIIRCAVPTQEAASALKEIKKIDGGAQVIMCSAMGQQAMVIESIQAGAKDFIVKPFQAERVIEAVKKVGG